MNIRVPTLIALILLMISTVPVPDAWAGAPIDVPGDHPTIQEAVDAAGPGDLIRIAPGIYHESIVIDVPDLRLTARDGLHTVVIDGTGLGDDPTGIDGIHVLADGVVLRHLVVRNFSGLIALPVNVRAGILVEGDECRLIGNLAHSNGDGIVLRDASGCIVRGNTARNNIHNGFFLRNGSNDNQVKDNVALDNGPDVNPAPDGVPAGVGCGIQLSFEANGNEIKRNRLSGNGRGLQVDRDSTGNLAKRNVSTNNIRFGIAALAVGGQPAASGNTFRNNVALANGEFDLIDQNDPPPGNTFRNNRFETSNF